MLAWPEEGHFPSIFEPIHSSAGGDSTAPDAADSEVREDNFESGFKRFCDLLSQMMAGRFLHLCGLLTIPLFLLGVANTSQARIGDTLQEAIQRYGKAVKKASAGEFAMFKEASYYVTAHFHDDKTDAITYVKAAHATPTNGAFSDREIEKLLRINGNGQTWERSKAKAGLYEWKTEDGELQAVYSESKFLVITTASYLKRLEEAAKKKKAAAEENERQTTSDSQEKRTVGKKKFTPSPGKSSSAPEGRGD